MNESTFILLSKKYIFHFLWHCYLCTNIFLGISESQLFAKIDYECRLRGAEFLAYPPVVAGGDRGTIIHYINNNQLVMNNELVLMDAGKINIVLLLLYVPFYTTI